MPTESEKAARRGRPRGKKSSLRITVSQAVLVKILKLNEDAGGFESVSITAERLLRKALESQK